MTGKPPVSEPDEPGGPRAPSRQAGVRHDAPVSGESRRDASWGSDLIALALRELDIPYVANVPGSSYTGLHDSIVNLLGNRAPQLILALHEESAVAIAHGYAKASDRMIAAALHANVGLMRAPMAVYNAWCDRAPVLLLGATGPWDATRRRSLDWIHPSGDQGALVRGFTKWDDQPGSPGAAVEALLRAAQIARTTPRGPVYVNLDVALQEERLGEAPRPPEVGRYAAPPAPSPPPELVAGRRARWCSWVGARATKLMRFALGSAGEVPGTSKCRKKPTPLYSCDFGTATAYCRLRISSVASSPARSCFITPTPVDSADVARVLGLPLDQLDRVLEVRVPWERASLWFTPTEADAEALVRKGVSRGRIWTSGELQDLLAIAGISKAGARTIALTKIEFDGEITDVRPTNPLSPSVLPTLGPIKVRRLIELRSRACSLRCAGAASRRTPCAWLGLRRVSSSQTPSRMG